MSVPGIVAAFCSTLAARPGSLFLETTTGSTSYARQAKLLAGLVGALNERGAGPGDRVVVHSDDQHLAIDLALACLAGGVIPVFVSEAFSSEYVARVAERVDARFVIDSGGLTPTDRVVPPERWAGRDRPLEAPCLIQPTSGSTGTPKLVLTPEASFALGGSEILRSAASSAGRVLMAASVAHGIGMSSLFGSVIHGLTMLLPSQIDTATPPDEVCALRPTFAYVTPRVIAALLGTSVTSADIRSVLGPDLETLVVAGAPPDAELLTNVRAAGIDIREMYGSSEAGDVAMTPPRGWRPGAIGPPLPGVAVRIDDAELVVSSAGVMSGFIDSPDEADRWTSDGFLRTGDLAAIDEDGYVRLLGRRTAMLNTTEGTNVDPSQLEARLLRIAGVDQAVVVGDQRPHLAALLYAGIDADSGRIRAAVATINEQLENIEQLRAVHLLDSPLPAEVYRVHLGKTIVNRAAVTATLEREIAEIYSTS